MSATDLADVLSGDAVITPGGLAECITATGLGLEPALWEHPITDSGADTAARELTTPAVR